MRLAAVVLIVLLAPQEEVQALIRQLNSDDIEKREAAASSLVGMGEKVREPLKRAALAAEPILRQKIESVLKSLDYAADRRKWISADPRVSLSGETSLQEVAQAVKAAGGFPVQCDAWPEGRFTLELKDTPIWDALEAACRASGKASLFCGADGPVLKGDRYVAIPSTHLQELRLHVGDVGEGRMFYVEPNRDQKSFQLRLHLGWSGGAAPVLAYLEVGNAVDDVGNDVAPILAGSQKSIGHPTAIGGGGVVFSLGSGHLPDSKAIRINSLSGSLILYHRASDDPISLRLDVPKEEAAATIQIVDERLAEVDSWPLSFRLVVRGKTDHSCSVKLERVEQRVRAHFLKWNLRDKDGKAYPGSVTRTMHVADRETTLTLEFPRVSDDVALVQLESSLPRRMIRRIVPFELKDIRIR